MTRLILFLFLFVWVSCGTSSDLNDADQKYSDGKYQEAAEAFTKMIETEKNVEILATLYYKRGLSFLQLKSFQQALSDFEWASQLKPKESMYLEGKAEAHSMMGFYRDAEAEYTQAIGLDQERSDLFYKRAMNYRFMQFYIPAQKDIEKAMELNPDNSDYLYEQGLLYIAVHRKDLACSTMKKAQSTGNKKAEAWLKKANCI